MPFQNLTLNRVIIHEVFQRTDERAAQPPRYGTGLVQLDPEARDALRDRIVDAMGSASRSMGMSIIRSDAASAVHLANTLVDLDDALFIQTSKSAADMLTTAQSRRGLPGGILVVFSGTSGFPAKRILGLIKAETHNGFTRQLNDDGAMSLRFLKDLLLTPQTRLYKIGIFIEANPGVDKPLNEAWKAVVYDDGMTATNRLSAAQYFYEGFLGCGFPETSARLTKSFHDLTKNFIRGLDLPEDTKTDLHTALITYLKIDQSATVEVAAFAETYLPSPELRDAYAQFMYGNEFPENAVPKDLADVAGSLKTRKVSFSNNIKLTAPAEQFDNYIRMKTIDGEPDANGLAQQWTEIIVRDRIRGQE